MKTVIVTGANKGIGKELCRQLARKGYQVVLTARDEKKGKDVVAEMNEKNIVFHQLDVTDKKSIAMFSQWAHKEIGAVDVLINNAAILIDQNESIDKIEGDKVRTIFETNVFGALALSQAIIPLMKNGKVINISSGAGSLSEPLGMYPAYSMSKTALNSITVQLAKAHSSLDVVSVCPGWVKTDMGGSQAPRSVKVAAEHIIWLVENKIESGKIYRDRKVIEW